MNADKKGLMRLILAYLKNELRGGELNSEHTEGLEVAIQCLESIYEVGDIDETEPDISEIYQYYLSSKMLLVPDSSEEDKKEADILKCKGNTAMNAQNYDEAIECYSRAIQLDPKNAVFYCNRAAAYSKLNDHRGAIRDCRLALDLDPRYSKAYSRLGLAYTGLEDYEQAYENYKKASMLDPDNQGYKNNILLAEQKCKELGQSAPASDSGANAGGFDVNAMFNNPHLMNIASQMLANPSMQNIMTSIVSGNLGQDGGGMDALFQAGQALAQQLQSDNPELVHQLRESLNNCNCPGNGSGDGTPKNDKPPQ